VILSRDWEPAAGLSLEPNARSAVTSSAVNLLVLAGPGSGKTEMLAQRADYLLRTGGCPYPRRILAIAFKTDAAANLRRRVANRCGRDLSARLDSYTFDAFSTLILRRFRVVLTGENALDANFDVGPDRIIRRQITFADMVPLATEIVESSAVVRNVLRNSYSHVFLDEFQDCTTSQYRLLKAAFPRSTAEVTAVGDTNQRIMVWAGALKGVFKQFATDFESPDRIRLFQNWRSAPRIRRVHNAMVKVMDPNGALDDSDLAENRGEVEIATYPNCAVEASNLAGRIASWIQIDGLAASEIAILVRQQPALYAQRLMAELSERGISYRNEQEVQDDLNEPLGALITDFLAVAIHDRQGAAYQRLMAIPLS
jgi:superfamily I DNA/RNA helicase